MNWRWWLAPVAELVGILVGSFIWGYIEGRRARREMHG